jgi:hypothetical protein
MINKKHEIRVCDANGHLFAIVKRKLKFEAIGNFCPAFVTYKGKCYLVKSDEGDLSDPFRANESYLKSLFIVIK